MQETHEQKTARITREIEEERKRRHEKMDQEFEAQRKIKKSEAKEYKKIKKEEKAEERKLFLHKIKMGLLKIFWLLFAGLKIFFFILLWIGIIWLIIRLFFSFPIPMIAIMITLAVIKYLFFS